MDKKAAAEVSQERMGVSFPGRETGHDDISGMTVSQNMETDDTVEALRATKEPDEKDYFPGMLGSETDEMGGKSGKDSEPTPNQQDVAAASQAAQAGQKDFVSSQMLMSLLREVDDNQIVQKYITVFEKACDALGRLYIQVLWRVDTFEERFGKAELKEFRSTLVSIFQQLGDFVCYLRQRDVSPSPVLSLGESDLDEAGELDNAEE
jgi:hypothetical protein